MFEGLLHVLCLKMVQKKTLLVQVLKHRTVSISPTIKFNQIRTSHSQGLWSEIGGNLNGGKKSHFFKKG